MFNQIKIKMINKRIIKLIFVMLITILAILASTSCQALSSNGNDKIIKLKNVPKAIIENINVVFYSQNEVLFPGEYSCVEYGQTKMHGPECKRYEQTTAKIYNVNTQNIFDTNARMNIQRSQYEYVALSDGRVLILGGLVKSNNHIKDVYEAEIFNPATQKFEIIGKPNFHYAYNNYASKIPLDEYNILLIRGASMEIFNLKTNTFKTTGNYRKITAPIKEYSWIINSDLFFISDGKSAKIRDLKTRKVTNVTSKEELKKYSKYIKEAKRNNDNRPVFDVCTLYNYKAPWYAYWPASESFQLDDERIYIIGMILVGDSDSKYEWRAEIYNPKTNISVPAQTPKNSRNIEILKDGNILFVDDATLYKPATNQIVQLSASEINKLDYKDLKTRKYKNFIEKLNSNNASSVVINMEDNRRFIYNHRATVDGMIETSAYLYKH